MKTQFLFLPVIALLLASCDKAKDMADQASAVMVDELKRQVGVEEKPLTSGSEVGPDTTVNQTEDGVVFRKDLPFPTHIRCKTTIISDVSARFFHSSQLGKKVENVKGEQKQVFVVEREGPRVTYTLKEAKFTVPALEKDKEDQVVKNPLQQIEPSKEPIVFQFDGSKWKADESNFKTMVLSKELSPVFDQLLIHHAIKPRPLWFSTNRIKIGSEIKVSGDLLPMLLAGDVTGTLNLKLEAVESIKDHPCAVFSVTGDYSREQFPDFHGGMTDQEVTIESGKLWLSLLYPIVLKEELNTIQTFRPGGNSGVTGRGQGTIEVSVIREWTAAGLNAGSN